MCICSFALLYMRDWPCRKRTATTIDTYLRIYKEKANKSYCQFFLSLPFLLFRVIQKKEEKKTRGEKKKEATRRPTSLSATPPRAKLSLLYFAIRSLTIHTHTHTQTYIIYTYTLIASSSLSSQLFIHVFFLFSSTYITIISLPTVSSQQSLVLSYICIKRAKERDR